MNDKEDMLKRFRVKTPSENLDRRMEQLFAGDPERRTARGFRHPIPLWACAAACVFCAAAVWTIRPSGNSAAPIIAEPAMIRYVVEIHKPGENLFDWTQYPAKTESRWETRVNLSLPGRQEENAAST
jgi:hypothetical protein